MIPSVDAQNNSLMRVNLQFSGDNVTNTHCQNVTQQLLANPAVRTARTLTTGRHFCIYEAGNGINQTTLYHLFNQHNLSISCYHETAVDQPLDILSWEAYQECVAKQGYMAPPTMPIEKAFNDCNTSQNICHGSTFNVIPWGAGILAASPDGNRNPMYSNFGTPSPWNNPWNQGTNNGCLQSGELHTIWLIMTVTAAGDLEWSFDFPATGNNGSTNFMDWIIWKNSPTLCADVTANNAASAPLRCNWNLGPDFSGSMGHTGMLSDSANLPLHNADQQMNFELSTPANVGDQFILLLDNWSGETFNGVFNFQMSPNSCQVCGILLDTEWRNFDVTKKDQQAILTWQTDQEESCDAYIIERSTDGMTWQTIGKVAGNGTTSSTHYYEFVDDAPMPGANYYRIHQQLFSGAKLASAIKFVEFELEHLPHFQISPNPSTEKQIQLTTHNFGEQPASIKLLDLYGQTVYQQTCTLPDHFQTITITPTTDLEQGVYLLLIDTPTGTLKKKVIVQ